MPRNGSGVYSLPAGSVATTGATILASTHNNPIQDLATDANTARPVVAGGTGATTAKAAREGLNLPLHFETRAAFVTWVGAGNTANDGTTAIAAGFMYEADSSASGISDLAGWKPYGEAYADHWGQNVTPGTTDMTSAINAAFTAMSGTDRGVRFRGGAYAVSSTISVPTKTGFVMEPGSYLYALASGFTNTDPTARLGSTALVVNFSGQTSSPFTPNVDQFWFGGGIRYETTAGRVVDGILARNCKNLHLDGLYFSGFPVTLLIIGETLTGEWRMRNILAENCTNGSVLTGGTAGNMQITVIQIDDSRVNSTPSSPGTIENVTARTCWQTGSALTTYSQQSDVVNLNGPAAFGFGHRLANVHGYQVGEVVDCFLDHCVMVNISGEKVDTVLKFIHAAQYNVATNVSGYKVRRQCVLFEGGNTRDTAYNKVSNVICRDIDPDDEFLGSYVTAAVRFSDQGLGQIATQNVVDGIFIDPGDYGQHGILFADDSTRNRVLNIRFGGAPVTSQYKQAVDGANFVQETTPTVVRAYVSGAQVVASGATLSVVEFDAEATGGDYRNEFNTGTHTFTAEVPGWYQVFARTRWTASAADTKLAIFVNSSEVASQQEGSAGQNAEVNTLVYLDDGDTLNVRISQQSGGSRTLTAGSANSGLVITGPII